MPYFRRSRKTTPNQSPVPPEALQNNVSSRSSSVRPDSPARSTGNNNLPQPSKPPDNFVMQPPKQSSKGLTGKISTLFRRESPQKSFAKQNQEKLHALARAEVQHVNNNNKRGGGDDDTISRSSRIFYSSNYDDNDSEDSYETQREQKRHSRSSKKHPAATASGSRTTTTLKQPSNNNKPYASNSTEDDSYTLEEQTTIETTQVIKRYRGFSTSISSLFLDESLVCGAFGCFGLLLSARTEYLLQLRNERRGALSPRSFRHGAHGHKRMPSRIVATVLLLVLVLMFSTFLIWGFGTGNGVVNDYINGYDYYDYDENQQQQQQGGNNNNNNNNNVQDYWDDYLGDDQYRNNNNNNYQNYNGDDDDNNNYQNDNGDDYQAAQNDDGGQGQNDDAQRFLQQEQEIFDMPHAVHGIFKIRDYQETFWEPVRDILRDIEWTKAVLVHDQKPQQHHRRQEDADYDDDASYSQLTDDAASNNNDNDDDDDDANNDNHAYQTYRQRRDIASDIRIGLLFLFLLFLGILGRRRRMRTRFYLVRARAQEDHLYYASSDDAVSRKVAFDDTREDQYEGACSHTLCGCYPVDEVDEGNDDENVEVADQGVFMRKRKRLNQDIVARTFNCLLGSCCGVLCKCWFQCLSICALAQEAREVRLLIPPRYQRIDVITHQPFHEYQEAVNDLRRGWLGKARRISGIMPHFNALSRLSRYIVVLSFLTVAAIVATLVFNPRAAFSWQDAVVLMATFVQSFLVLFVVHWIFHKSDLSLDAVIKMFASGFLIATPTAFVFEGLLVNLMLGVSYLVYDVVATVIGDAFDEWIDTHWRAIWILAELFNAYVVAAVTEELCKYYSFRSVEHPDLVFLTGLQRENQDASAMAGGIVKYPFGSHQVQALTRQNSFGDEASYRSGRSGRSSRSGRETGDSQSRDTRNTKLLEQTGTTEHEYDEDELDVRTRRQRAMAITTGMISVAVGLACAENFLYVFVLGGALGHADPQEVRQGDVMEAWIVLFFRSIFPVHALSAAMQSINMIRKFVEGEDHGGHRVGVGRIILPAVILHGTFDAVLLGINVFVETAWDDYLEANGGQAVEKEPYNAIFINILAWISIILIMAVGFFWYYRENRNQRARLILLEEQDKALQAEQWEAAEGPELPVPVAPVHGDLV